MADALYGYKNYNISTSSLTGVCIPRVCIPHYVVVLVVHNRQSVRFIAYRRIIYKALTLSAKANIATPLSRVLG